ncbi:MAG: class I SAM-dependent methyltransferase [Acidimicrobiales bacterium]|nr:class I SAM-dependent methyltransferase [Acidimicrobiales bacterium]
MGRELGRGEGLETARLTGREFEALAAHAGRAYLRYSFTKGTEQEVRFLAERLELHAGDRVLDVGCGPGRHAVALRARGVEVVGLDVSQRFLADAGPGSWVRADARLLPFRAGAFDAAISLCQGGFGLLGGEDDPAVLHQMAAVVRPGGRLAVSAFSSYFAVRHLEEGEVFDASSGVNHERTEVRNPEGEAETFDLWTTCFTPRELRMMAAQAGIEVEGVWSVTPGGYQERPPDLEHPEFLLVGGV